MQLSSDGAGGTDLRLAAAADPNTTETVTITQPMINLGLDLFDSQSVSFAAMAEVIQGHASTFQHAARDYAKDPLLLAALADPATTGSAKQQEIGHAILQLADTLRHGGLAPAPTNVAAAIGAAAIQIVRHGALSPDFLTTRLIPAAQQQLTFELGGSPHHHA